MMNAEQFYGDYFTADGSLKLDKALAIFDTIKLPLEYRILVRDGDWEGWEATGIPSWFMPYRDISPWELESLIRGRTIGMRNDKTLRSSSVSLPLLGAWLSAGSGMLEAGADPDAIMEAMLARDWDTAFLRKQQQVVEKLAKDNPIQFLKRTDQDGDFDDHEARRQMQFKKDLDKELQEEAIQVEFNFGKSE